MNEIAITKCNLPANIDDLGKFVLFGEEKLNSVRAEIRAMNKLNVADAVLRQKQDEARQLTETVTYAQIRIGEITASMPKNQGARSDLTSPEGWEKLQTKKQALDAAGLNNRRASEYERMAANQEIVEQVLADARESDDIASRSDILNAIKKAERKQAIQEQVDEIERGNVEKPDGLFDVIAIDPPWNYGTQYDSGGRRVANPYPEMSQEELKALEIPAKENCVMFLWTTQRFIWDAKELLDTWGFTYRAMLVWDKEKIGMGDLIRMQCEFCLIGVKGKPVFKGIRDVRDIIREPRREHSRKPQAFYELVEAMCAGRKLDYFSREAREGWCSYGNDTERF